MGAEEARETAHKMSAQDARRPQARGLGGKHAASCSPARCCTVPPWERGGSTQGWSNWQVSATSACQVGASDGLVPGWSKRLRSACAPRHHGQARHSDQASSTPGALQCSSRTCNLFFSSTSSPCPQASFLKVFWRCHGMRLSCCVKPGIAPRAKHRRRTQAGHATRVTKAAQDRAQGRGARMPSRAASQAHAPQAHAEVLVGPRARARQPRFHAAVRSPASPGVDCGRG